MTETSLIREKSRILVVDDDRSARLLARSALELAHFEVFEAEDGKPAIEVFEANKIDMVLLDVVMKEMNGFEVCSVLRSLEAGRHVPIMMMTGLDDVDSVNQAYLAGATDFVIKPINFFVLTHRIRYLLRSARTAAQLRDSEARLENAQRMAKLGHFEWNSLTKVLLCSHEVERLFGVGSGAVLPDLAPLLKQVHAEDIRTVGPLLDDAISSKRNVHISFRVVVENTLESFVHLEATTVANPEGVYCFSGTVQDISELKRAEGQAYQLTYFDSVTGLPNRANLRQEIRRMVADAQRTHREMAVLSIDIDNFRTINDTLGRAKGDEVLRLVAQRLVECLHNRSIDEPEDEFDGSLVARTGGDEFYVVLNNVRTAEESVTVVRKIQEALAEPIMIDLNEIIITQTIGIAVYPLDGRDPDTLIEHADAAKHHAKNDGGNTHQFYTASINARAFARLSMEKNLRQALQLGQFELYLQPKVELATRDIIGAEALVRWRHPELGIVLPSDFIPLAEETGLIIPLGEWIIREVCRYSAAWRARGVPGLSVALNLSAVQFRSEKLIDSIHEALDETNADPSSIEFEITETTLMDNVDHAVNLLKVIKDLGAKLWIDDFGTGYSSLAYLKKLPISGLKIDRSFVREMQYNEQDTSIVSAIIALAKNLNLDVVAEGIETDSQLELLRRCGCNVGQGYLFSRPVPTEEFERSTLVDGHHTALAG